MMNKVEEVVKWLEKEATIKTWIKLEQEAEDKTLAIIKRIEDDLGEAFEEMEEKIGEKLTIIVGAYKQKGQSVAFFTAVLTKNKWEVLHVEGNENTNTEIRKYIEKNRLRLFTQRELYEVLK